MLLIVRQEDADSDLDASNPYRYLDRQLVKVEKVIHNPDSWGIDPDYTDVEMTGFEVEDPSDDNEFMCRLFITFQYRHDYQNPEA